MRPRARAALLALAAVATFGAVVAIQLGRSRHAAVAPGEGTAAPGPTEPPPAAALAPAGPAVEQGAVAAAGQRGDPTRPTRPALSIRLELGSLDAASLPRAILALALIGADGVEQKIASTAALGPVGGSFATDSGFRAVLSSEATHVDVRVEGLPPGPVRGLVIVRSGAGAVLGIGGPASINIDAKEALLDVVPADRLGAVVAEVRRGGVAFGPATVVVRTAGLTVGTVAGARGRAMPVPAPTGTPLEVALLDAPGHGDLGLPSPQELTLAPRETRDVGFDLDEGVAFSIRALDRAGSPLPFRTRVFTDREGRGPRPAPGLLLTSGTALEHTGRGPVGELAVLVIPSRTGAPTWARVALAGRGVVPIDVRVGLEGGVLDLRLVNEAGAPRAGWQVDLVRTDAAELFAFAAWSGSADGEGHLVTPPLPAGAYLLEVGGRFVRPITLPAAGLTLSLAVPDLQSPTIAGPILDVTMSDADGHPRAIASTYVRPEDDGWGQRLIPRRDEPGRFEAAVLSAGRFRVVVPWTWETGPRHGAVDVPITLLGEGVLRLDVPVPPP